LTGRVRGAAVNMADRFHHRRDARDELELILPYDAMHVFNSQLSPTNTQYEINK